MNDYCYEYINKDLYIENLLKRLYNIENDFYNQKKNDKKKRINNLDNCDTSFNDQIKINNNQKEND